MRAWKREERRRISATEGSASPRPGLDRRDVLRLGLAGGAAAVVGGWGTAPDTRAATAPGPSEASRAREGAGEGVFPQGSFELDEATLPELQEGMSSGRWSSRRLCELYLERIEAVDAAGPTLRSVLEVNPAALEIADRLDDERRQGQVRGPLHGVPVMIKDNIDTADGMMTTAGSLALVGPPAPVDAAVVARLRDAGAVILAKTNLSEWANFRSTRSSSGWSGRGGQTLNPCVLDRSPCGSSSGSGVAVAANLCAVALGTETDGSVVCPSSASGIVGVKPTIGRVSRVGIVPIAHTQDTAGPMARTVADAAALLAAVAGIDEQDPATRGAPAPADMVAALAGATLDGARIGVARDMFGFHDRVDRLMEEALEVLAAEGAELVDPAEVSLGEELGDAEFEVLLYEFKADLDAYLAGRRNAPVASLAEVIAFNEENAAREMPWFGQEIMEMAVDKGPLTDDAYRDALATCRRLARTEGIDRVMDEHDLDALVAPTDGPAWCIDLVNGDHYLGGSSTAAAVAGYPSVTVPAGAVHGLPVGILFFGRPFTEGSLLALAHAYERASGHRSPPGFRSAPELA